MISGVGSLVTDVMCVCVQDSQRTGQIQWYNSETNSFSTHLGNTTVSIVSLNKMLYPN